MECSKCGYTNGSAKYCENCGNRLFQLKSADTTNDPSTLKKILLVYSLLLIYLLVNTFVFKDLDSTTNELLEWCFYILITILAGIYYKDWVYLLSFKNFKWKKLLLLEAGLIALAFVVDLLVPHLNKALGHGETNYMYEYMFTAYPLLSAIFHTAVLPAIFEEISLRGFVFTHTANFMSLKSAIFVTAFLFFLLHLSIISIIWLFGIGIVFGYFRARHRTLWYGIIGHFTYNATVVLIDYYKAYF